MLAVEEWELQAFLELLNMPGGELRQLGGASGFLSTRGVVRVRDRRSRRRARRPRPTRREATRRALQTGRDAVDLFVETVVGLVEARFADLTYDRTALIVWLQDTATGGPRPPLRGGPDDPRSGRARAGSRDADPDAGRGPAGSPRGAPPALLRRPPHSAGRARGPRPQPPQPDDRGRDPSRGGAARAAGVPPGAELGAPRVPVGGGPAPATGRGDHVRGPGRTTRRASWGTRASCSRPTIPSSWSSARRSWRRASRTSCSSAAPRSCSPWSLNVDGEEYGTSAADALEEILGEALARGRIELATHVLSTPRGVRPGGRSAEPGARPAPHRPPAAPGRAHARRPSRRTAAAARRQRAAAGAGRPVPRPGRARGDPGVHRAPGRGARPPGPGPDVPGAGQGGPVHRADAPGVARGSAVVPGAQSCPRPGQDRRRGRVRSGGDAPRPSPRPGAHRGGAGARPDRPDPRRAADRDRCRGTSTRRFGWRPSAPSGRSGATRPYRSCGTSRPGRRASPTSPCAERPSRRWRRSGPPVPARRWRVWRGAASGPGSGPSAGSVRSPRPRWRRERTIEDAADE